MQSTALIIDDDRFMRDVLTDLLGGDGFRILVAGDGEEGWQQAEANFPDIILLDLVMPKMDGVAACRKIRSIPRLKHTPIILMTCRTEMEGMVNPFQLGADDYISKPFDDFELIARVRGNLAKKRTVASLARSADNFKILLDVSTSVTSTLDTVEILRQIVGKMPYLLGDVDRCSVALVQEDERRGYVMASSDDPNLGGLRIFLDKYPEIRQVLRTGEPVLIDDVTRGPFLATGHPLLDGQKFNTNLVLPVVYRQRIIGAMVVQAIRPRAGISPKEIELCQLVANISANAIKNAQHFELLHEEAERLQSAKERLEADLCTKAVYEQLFDNASDALIAFDTRGRAVFANHRALDISGYSAAELKSVSLVSLLELKSIRLILKRRRDAMAGISVPPSCDLAIRTRSGERRLLSVSFNSRIACGDLQVVAIRDVTEKRQVEMELELTRSNLEAANQRLRQVDQIRGEFLNTAAHELRIPVTIVSGYCSLLKDMGTENFSEQQREFLDQAVEGSDRLVDLINNILDLSRFDAGRMLLEVEEKDIVATIHEVLPGFVPLAEKNGLLLNVGGPEACRALFDPEAIHRVLINLVGNALKFTPRGGTVTIEAEDAEEEVRICVADTGKGIPEERIPDLFKEFTQLGKEDSRRGTGLGLSICKKIIESHQGRIWAESQLGQGSRFIFTLPKSA
jgi:PAS domain S-box-containing protein